MYEILSVLFVLIIWVALFFAISALLMVSWNASVAKKFEKMRLKYMECVALLMVVAILATPFISWNTLAYINVRKF